VSQRDSELLPKNERKWPSLLNSPELRSPTRPGLSLASCQLIPTAITAGVSRVASGLLCVHAIAITPAGSMKLVRSSISHRLRPSLCNSQVGSCNCFFEACSAFTHVMACTLSLAPLFASKSKVTKHRLLSVRQVAPQSYSRS
jgi:hypothetical protein